MIGPNSQKMRLRQTFCSVRTRAPSKLLAAFLHHGVNGVSTSKQFCMYSSFCYGFQWKLDWLKLIIFSRAFGFSGGPNSCLSKILILLLPSMLL